MTLFDIGLARVLADEGGYSNHPDDHGGATSFGVSIRFAGSIGLDLDGDGDTDEDDIKALTKEDAGRIYRKHFWDANRCGEMPAGVGYALFDGAVNQGPAAVKFMQRASNAHVDGRVGPLTLAAIAAAERGVLLDNYCTLRALHYAGLSTFETFGRGWYKRLFRVHRLACADQPPKEINDE